MQMSCARDADVEREDLQDYSTLSVVGTWIDDCCSRWCWLSVSKQAGVARLSTVRTVPRHLARASEAGTSMTTALHAVTDDKVKVHLSRVSAL